MSLKLTNKTLAPINRFFMPRTLGLYLSIILCFCGVIQASEQIEENGNTLSNPLKPATELDILDEADDELTRTGEISAHELISRYSSFKRHYDNYQPSKEDIEQFSQFNHFEAMVFFGLWCHDSQREVARFVKLISLSQTRFKSVKLIAINTRKMLNEQYALKYEVSNTPTFFIIKNHKVRATLVEKPKTSIAQDLLRQVFK